jgi:ergothioneine biosynthesis protein EgtB
VGLSREQLLAGYRQVRAATEALAAPLAIEDMVVQSMPDASPTRWHLAHTTWFFETFILQRALPAYRPVDERYAYLFNSYYVGVGERHPQAQRGLLSRPTVAQVRDYRRQVDHALERFLADAPTATVAPHAFAIELGLHHEQQHQELIVTDITHAFSLNPLSPHYSLPPQVEGWQGSPGRGDGWIDHPGGLVDIGHAGDGFAFDNEGPRHRVHLDPFALARSPVTNADWQAFITAGGYTTPSLWLSDGWDQRVRHDWRAPLYWRPDLDPTAAVCHISYYEADAYARWAGARLPREEEWEALAVSSGAGLPGAGEVWEWTASSYAAYPGYRPFAGDFGEYNGKFMSNRMVLRGGSRATPPGHIRSTYRNFFMPDARWQLSGLRLARPA